MHLLETVRLKARPIGVNDYPLIRAIHGDPKCAPQLSMDGPVIPEARTRAYLKWALEHWTMHDFGTYMFHQKDDGTYVGFGGLRHSELGGTDVIALSYCVCAHAWGKGLATEISCAVLQDGFARGMNKVVAITFPHHHASRRVLEKSGLTYQKILHHGGLDHVFYET